mgnify:CR=1 FL=1
MQHLRKEYIAKKLPKAPKIKKKASVLLFHLKAIGFTKEEEQFCQLYKETKDRVGAATQMGWPEPAYASIRMLKRPLVQVRMKQIWPGWKPSYLGFVTQGELTHQMEMFCREYVVCGVASRAARATGYAPGYAQFLMAMPNIQHRIEELKAEAIGRSDMDIDKVIKNLTEFANREPGLSPGDDRNTITANIELAKMFGAYTEKVQFSAKGEAGITMSELLAKLDLEDRKRILSRLREVKQPKAVAEDEEKGKKDLKLAAG